MECIVCPFILKNVTQLSFTDSKGEWTCLLMDKTAKIRKVAVFSFYCGVY